jgi:hypothetical protein
LNFGSLIFSQKTHCSCAKWKFTWQLGLGVKCIDKNIYSDILKKLNGNSNNVCVNGYTIVVRYWVQN